MYVCMYVCECVYVSMYMCVCMLVNIYVCKNVSTFNLCYYVLLMFLLFRLTFMFHARKIVIELIFGLFLEFCSE